MHGSSKQAVHGSSKQGVHGSSISKLCTVCEKFLNTEWPGYIN